MAAPRATRMNIPLRRVAVACALMIFALMGKVSEIQTLRANSLADDPRNLRAMIDRFAHPRGDILLRDNTVLATGTRQAGMFRYRRVYPGGPMYAPVTGHLSIYGATGVERAEDEVLSGADPKVRVRTLVGGQAEQGASVRLTIDSRAQRAAYEGLRATGHKGAAVAVDPSTGAILALASYPSYDPNVYATFDGEALADTDERLRADATRPLLNRATEHTYPPGSAFKIVTTAAALGTGNISPETSVAAPTRLTLPGTTTLLGNAGGEACGNGRPTLAVAFRLSCNTAFAVLGLQLGQRVLRAQAEAFGFNGAGPGIALPLARSVYPVRLDAAQTAMSAIGQFDVRATPFEITMIAAAVASRGVIMRPYLVAEVVLRDGTVVSVTDPESMPRTISRDVADQLTAMMVTVTGPGGTGSAAALPGIDVAAKTGTAENAAGAADHAVFTAFAPADEPRVAVGVVVENGGFGGDVAAPIARDIMKAVLD
ncbi:penicillin-binding protein A [Sphaerisporangium rufum]|uniref:Penicillin-binding protein A n=1 Tax=Sphaerisporangium rufum TaxID=1381558 RepID=A0A919R3Q1_9ACTN|nr:penicillin-binding protein 2 [Sphaerisporangium rufum]GII76550.1 penicillin-binding protein A [Sphaerisporangium rufum]